jgi:hypothetical protein
VFGLMTVQQEAAAKKKKLMTAEAVIIMMIMILIVIVPSVCDAETCHDIHPVGTFCLSLNILSACLTDGIIMKM